MKLSYLKSERQRLEQLFEKTLAQLSDAMKNDAYPVNMTSDIAVLMPTDVFKTFDDFMCQRDNSELRCRHVYYEIAVAMKKELADIEKKINSLLS